MPVTRNVSAHRRQSLRLLKHDPLNEDGFPKYDPTMFDSHDSSRHSSPATTDSDEEDESYSPPSPSPPPSQSSSRQRQGHIPRPRNPFMIFRSYMYQLKRREMGVDRMDQNALSREAGIEWQKLSPQERVPFVKQAEEEKAIHAAKYPGYKYNPSWNGNQRSKSYAPKRKIRTSSPARSSVTRSSVESDRGRARRITRPSLSIHPRAVSPVTATPAVPAPAKIEEEDESSPECRFFSMKHEDEEPKVPTPELPSHQRIGEQFGFRAGIDPQFQPTLAALNASDIISDILLDAKPSKKSKKRTGVDLHMDWELTSIQNVLDADRDMVINEPVDEPCFNEKDFGFHDWIEWD